VLPDREGPTPAAGTSPARYRCPRCHDVAVVATQCDRCDVPMIELDEQVVTSVHGGRTIGLRPSGVWALAALGGIAAVLALALAVMRIEAWTVLATAAAIYLGSLGLAALLGQAGRRWMLAAARRWPANATPTAIQDVSEGRACVAGRVVAVDAPLEADGVPCAAISTSGEAGITTRAVGFVVEDAAGQRVSVRGAEVVVCAGVETARGAAVPVGAEVELLGAARWRGGERDDAGRSLRSGPQLELTSTTAGPVRIRVRASGGAAAARVRVEVGAAEARVDAGSVAEQDDAAGATSGSASQQVTHRDPR
jgi:hypothetical protein